MPEFLRSRTPDRAVRVPVHMESQLEEHQLSRKAPNPAQLMQPQSMSVGQVQGLQRQIGNRAVAQLLQRSGEASPESSRQPALSGGGTPSVQRKAVDGLAEDAHKKAGSPKQQGTSAVIQRWPYDKDGTDLNWGKGLDKGNTMIGGFGGMKNYFAEKLSGTKLPKNYGRFFKGLDIANTGSKFMSEGITDDSVSSGISTGLNFVPQLMMFNLIRGGYDMTMEGMGKSHLTSTGLTSSFLKQMRTGAQNYSPIEMEYDKNNPFI